MAKIDKKNTKNDNCTFLYLAGPSRELDQNAQHDKITLEGGIFLWQRERILLKNFTTEEKLAILSEAPDEMIKALLFDLAEEFPFFGYKKLTFLLRSRFGIIINKKKGYRLCKEMDPLFPKRLLAIKLVFR